MSPETSLGQLMGSVCCLVGTLVIALPVPILEMKMKLVQKKPADKKEEEETEEEKAEQEEQVWIRRPSWICTSVNTKDTG